MVAGSSGQDTTIDAQGLLTGVFEAHGRCTPLGPGGEGIAPVDRDGFGKLGGDSQGQGGRRGRRGGELVPDQAQMLDHTAALLGCPQEALIGHAILVIAEDVPHMGEELQQHVAEVGLRLVIGPLR